MQNHVEREIGEMGDDDGGVGVCECKLEYLINVYRRWVFYLLIKARVRNPRIRALRFVKKVGAQYNKPIRFTY